MGDFDSKLCQAMVEETKSTSIERLVCDNFIAGLQQCPKQGSCRPHARRRDQSSLTSLKIGDSLLKKQGCRIADAGIYKSFLLARKAGSAIFHSGKSIGGAEIHWRVERTAPCIRIVSVVDRSGRKTFALTLKISH